MNCHNCGAPMSVMGDEDYFFCPYCGAFYFPDTSPDGVRVLGESSPVDCPVCKKDLVSAAAAQAPVLYCRNCRGILVGQNDFAYVVRQLRAASSGPESPPHRISDGERQRELDCPVCGRPMDRHPYYGPGNVMIDLCLSCQIVWLDYGELSIIINAPGKDRGQVQFYG